MKKDETQFSQFLTPRYWLLWIWLIFLRLAILFPYRIQLGIGRILGRVIHRIAPGRVSVARINIRHCYPDKSEQAVRQLALRHFESMGISFLETALCWWAPSSKLNPLLTEIKGLEHVRRLQQEGRGIILLGAHFTDMEISLRLLSQHVAFAPVYRKMNNPLLEHYTQKGRSKNTAGAIPKENMKQTIRHLRNGGILWFAPDQQHQGSHSALVNFFGQPAHSATATSDIARISQAAVVPCWFRRDTDGYRLELSAPLDNFPTDDVVADTERYHQLIEAQIDRCPEQYLWVHKRFKDVPGFKYDKDR
ncbi:lysophospholipid acyltransferase family protein [Motiliproteus sp. MSK22-1]|uniref:LpxL/LpxP family acyltransferase n=1 Tax=Motiliproteus sp. MSK22-1 TaxID=1897630 RepID=UPI000976E1D2|nr:lysophospholipid acyltransferase family protein [Motiliproteus sp. MSK22-1]OMH28010.1 hypothetical protein BGP75_21800 [Motiliproteus sp. MSK22-1]